MTFGKIFRFLIFVALLLSATAAILGYYYDVMPTGYGIHPQLYKISGFALDGYDVVNYQNRRTSNKGNVTYKYKLNESHWVFMSKTNMKIFVAKPKKYIPQFGGFCAYSVSKGYTYPPDPKVWKFYKGRLYLFKDEEAKKLALADMENTIKKANVNWK